MGEYRGLGHFDGHGDDPDFVLPVALAIAAAPFAFTLLAPLAALGAVAAVGAGTYGAIRALERGAGTDSRKRGR